MPESIVITEKDLIDRPAGIAGIGEAAKKAGSSPLSYLKDIQSFLKQAKEIMDMAKGMGLNIPGMNLPGMKTTESGEVKTTLTANPQPTPGQQMGFIMQLLAMRYGDITVDELLVKLREEFGAKKLSQLGKMK